MAFGLAMGETLEGLRANVATMREQYASLDTGGRNAGKADVSEDSNATIDQADGNLPTEYALHRNYPNPFNPATTIRFDLADAVHTSLSVYDMMGRRVRNLVNGVMAAGRHEVTFDAGDLPSGMYIYRLTTPTGALSKNMVLMK